MKGNSVIVSIVFFICIALYVSIKKIGREATLSWAMKILSPICIILFYLSDVSIIVPILEKFQVKDNVILSSDSIRVAVDSAIVTLFVNTLLSFLSFPIKVEVEARSWQDVEQLLISCNRSSKIEYSVKVISKYKWLLRWYKKHGKPVVRIKNSKNTSMVVDREKEYENVIDCSNASKYIDVNLFNFPESEKVYFTLAIQSNKTIKWDDVIKTEFYIWKRNKLIISSLFWHIKGSIIKIAHREESL